MNRPRTETPVTDAGRPAVAPELPAAAQIDQLARTIERQQAALGRLRGAREAAAMSEDERKNLREVMAHSLAVRALLRNLQDPPRKPASAPGGDATIGQEHRFTALARTAAVVNSSLDLAAVLAEVMDNFLALTGAERGFIMLREDSDGTMAVRTARNLDRETLAAPEFEISRSVVKAVARDGRAVVTTNAQLDPRFNAEHSVLAYSLRSIACAPLRARGRVTGVLYAEHRVKAGQFDAASEELLVAFADQASVAIENARLHAATLAAGDLVRNVFDAVVSGVVSVDAAGRVVLFNRAAASILGIAGEHCTGKPLGSALGGFGSAVAPLVEQVRRRRVGLLEQELRCTLPGRGELQLRLDVAPLQDDSGDGAVMVFDDLTERRRLERQGALVRRYLPGQLVDALADIDELKLGGARETVSIFFADIRGFTSYSEKHDAVQVMEAINGYFGLASDAIHANHGIVDKYMGDAVMAHYNTPLRPEPDHAWLAVRTAWHTRLAIEAYRARNPDAAALEFGIGVNTGEAVAGNVGARDYMEYTLIGDAVNLAKRLQENAGPRQILLGRRTFELVRDKVKVVPLEPLAVKGREAREPVFELVGLNE